MDIAAGRALPVFMILLGGVIYHLAQKATPTRVDPFMSLFTPVGLASLACLAISMTEGKAFIAEIKKLSWTAFALAAALVAIESGYLIGYRNGLKLNITSLACNTAIAIALFAIGVFAYAEGISPKAAIGGALCLIGLALIGS
jgi:drug/metabolite transporter (DMT)-like permease